MSSMKSKSACLTLDLEHDFTIPGTPTPNPTFEYIKGYIDAHHRQEKLDRKAEQAVWESVGVEAPLETNGAYAK
ncbi:hypothetical protein HWV07_06845 [Natronomonas salina]|uniref:hypothetical protein n=1 Tax=Natronomonas salina TaxID=1710540 RepID=UPI0015B44C8F|nr:hypothetical protein [Natronomonas salina]QLD88766.1 hypothetical protein HWV07_06845 [Natronomonas salina]